LAALLCACIEKEQYGGEGMIEQNLSPHGPLKQRGRKGGRERERDRKRERENENERERKGEGQGQGISFQSHLGDPLPPIGLISQ
jgi:hypothetical protein